MSNIRTYLLIILSARRRTKNGYQLTNNNNKILKIIIYTDLSGNIPHGPLNPK